jgi:hypothetical protein
VPLAAGAAMHIPPWGDAANYPQLLPIRESFSPLSFSLFCFYLLLSERNVLSCTQPTCAGFGFPEDTVFYLFSELAREKAQLYKDNER